MSSASEIPEDVLRFVEAYVESIDQLEILRVLGEHPDRGWPVPELAAACQIDPAKIAATIALLERRGLVVNDSAAIEPVVRFEPRTAEVREAALRLLTFYRERPVTLIRVIYARVNGRIRAFADAFRLRQEE
jgi:hypothetical protein